MSSAISEWIKRLEHTKYQREVDNQSRMASVALIIHEGEEGTSLLYIKRAIHPQDPWSGQIGFPGGKAEKGENSIDAALRECQEELGIALEKKSLIGILNPMQAYAYGKELNLKIYPHIFYQKYLDDLTLDSSEVDSVHSLSLQQLVSPSQVTQISYNSKELPGIKLNNDIIWGLTYLITRDFLMQLEGLPIGSGNLQFAATHLQEYKRL